jgi:transcription antitermination protein NusB
MGIRRKAREAALQMLYQMDMDGMDMSDAAVAQIVQLYWRDLAQNSDGQDFANALVHGCAQEHEHLDNTIRSVSQHWRLERMDRVDRNILRLGTYELLRLADVPRRVTLNEAVELAKRFGSESSPSFVNGVLDRIAADLKKD